MRKTMLFILLTITIVVVIKSVNKKNNIQSFEKTNYEVLKNSKNHENIDDKREDILIEKIEKQESVAFNNVRDQRIKKQLDIFIDRTKSITKESIQQERKKLDQRIQIARQDLSEEAIISSLKDGKGNPWQKLEYGHGIVRYLPAPR
jgi:biopolymer transport protein ExbB/TolQ